LILAVDTSTRFFSVSLFQKRELASVELAHELAHSQQIARIVQFLLERLGLSINEITEAYAGTGPGSFTGIRIALSFVNTLAQVFHIPLAGVSSLDLLAFENGRWYNSVITFIRSRKNEVYTAFYKNGGRVTEHLVLGKEDFLRFVHDHTPHYLVAPEDSFRDIVPESDEAISRRTGKACDSGPFSESSNKEIQSGKTQTVFSYPRSRTILQMVAECGLKPEYRYLKPFYGRDI